MAAHKKLDGTRLGTKTLAHDALNGIEMRLSSVKDIHGEGEVWTFDVLVDGDPERWFSMSLLPMRLLDRDA